MAKSKFTEEARQAAIDRFAAGLSVADTASAVGLNEGTLKGWLTRGNSGHKKYEPFAQGVKEAREQARSRPVPMTEAEHRLVVSEAARRGHAQALKLYWEMILHDRKGDEAEELADPLAELDDLAERRSSRA